MKTEWEWKVEKKKRTDGKQGRRNEWCEKEGRSWSERWRERRPVRWRERGSAVGRRGAGGWLQALTGHSGIYTQINNSTLNKTLWTGETDPPRHTQAQIYKCLHPLRKKKRRRRSCSISTSPKKQICGLAFPLFTLLTLPPPLHALFFSHLFQPHYFVCDTQRKYI